ncbi:STAS domain-containing protein [Actinoplanes sichuanensis]|nr:STAS domain-containing protein [Actinoplanes sichuanensis]
MVRTLAGASVVRIVGDVDLAAAGQLRTALGQALVEHPWIIVDLRRVAAVDSVGLGVLIAAREAARRQSGDLLLAATPPFFRSVLQAARLETVFPTFDTVPQAMTFALAD